MGFFDDLGPRKKEVPLRVPPPPPETGWRAPSTFPNLSSAAVIGFDVERRESDWKHGPGWAKGRARTCGFSIAAKDRAGNSGAWYFPIEHEIEKETNLDPANCKAWLKHTLETTPDIPKVGANLLYDIGSLTDDNISVKGTLYDVQFAEALLQSDGLVNLDHLGKKYLGVGKETNKLYEWCSQAYGGKPNETQRMNIWQAPPRLVGPYGEGDALLPINILEKQWPLLQVESLLDLFHMECGLIPLLIKMRLAGITIDLDAAEQLYFGIGNDISNIRDQLFNLVPIRIDSANSGQQIAKLFDYIGQNYPLTRDGNPSFRKDWLKNLDNPVADKINEWRECEKIRGTFIDSYILKGHVNGKIHCQFHPLRGDDSGTVTGRFSSSDPNLQNIPVRTELGKRIRKIFTKDDGHICYEKNDYSQMEYRDLAHYAVDNGDGSADRLREAYRLDPNTDYHLQTQKNVKQITGFDIERRPIKNLNFGMIYGMSEKKLIRQNGFSPEQGKKLFKAYHEGNPYVRPTMKAAADEMQTYGYITTVLGRRTRFNLWEPMNRDYNQDREQPLEYEDAIRQWGSQIKRAGEHKAINYRLQGSNAEQIKKGMHDCYYSGVFDATGIPRLQIHDELGFSVEDDSPRTREAFTEMRRILETCIPLRVPVRVDWKRGPNWGSCE